MDEPGLEGARHARALRALARINRISGTARALFAPIRSLASQDAGGSSETRPALRVMDVACGGGDVARTLARLAQRAGVPLRIDGCDRSPRAVEYARAAAAADGAPVRFFERNALAGPLPGSYDVITCSLFLHHLSEGEAVALLEAMRRAARRLVLVDDLVRSPFGLLLSTVAPRILTTSDVVHVDAPRSVRAAFTPVELRNLASRAGMRGAKLRVRWPARALLAWRAP